MGSKMDVATKCIVVAKDYSSKSVMASVVPVKGASNEFPAKRISAFIREIGLEGQDLVPRSDQEPALKDLLAEVGRRRIPAKTFLRGLTCGIVSFEWSGRKRSTDC